MRIVIVGNGVAGIEAALAVRRQRADWDVTIVSEESDHFFSRTALMWVASGQLTHRDTEPYERDLYERMRFRRVRARACGIDSKGKRLLLANTEETVPYDRLLLACGSRARPAPWEGAELPGVGHLVTLQDLEWLEREVHGGPNRGGRPPRPDHHCARSQDGSPYMPRSAASAGRGRTCREPAVIGGGLIGIEAVEVLLAAGRTPRLFVREEWFWPMAIDRDEAGWIARRMQEHGVLVHLEHEVSALEGGADGCLRAVQTNRGRYEADMAVVAIGVVPNTQWLEGSGVQLDGRSGGVSVGAELEASVPDVFAAGDCAAVPWGDGTRRPEQLWYTARDQGRVAGRRLLGEEATYGRGTWYNSAKLADVEYTTAGRVGAALEAQREWKHEERGRVRSMMRVVLQEGAVVGFNMLGRRWDHNVLVRWIDERRSLPFVLDHLEEARFDTELVPPLHVDAEARRRAEAL